MIERYGTTAEPKTVAVELLSYNAERGFGFAIDYDCRDEDRVSMKVFFHRSGCRKVAGTPKKPVLTQQRTTHTFDPGVPRQRMLMQVVEGARGLRAVAWGIPPHRTGATDLVEDGGVQRFVGGWVSLLGLRQENEYISGRVQRAQLAAGCLKLEVADAYINGHSLPCTFLAEVWLGEAWGTPLGATEYSLSTYAAFGGRRASVTFRLPQEP